MKKNVHLALFADDTALVATSRLPFSARNQAKLYASSITKYYNSWGLNINATKSQAVHFAGRRRPTPEPHIQLHGLSIPWLSSLNCLFITFERKLKFDTHLKKLKKKTSYQFFQLWPILHYLISIPSLQSFIDNLNKKFLLSLHYHSNPLIKLSSPIIIPTSNPLLLLFTNS